MQMMHFKYDSHVDIPNGMHAAVKGKLLQATFQPVWVDGLEKGAYSVSDSFAREKPVKRPRTDAGPDNDDSTSTHKKSGPSFHGNRRYGGTSDNGRPTWDEISRPVDNVSA
jgi:hypothetical protein